MENINLNKVIHEQARLKILVFLGSSPEAAVPFTDIKKQFDFTAGNLSIQLKTLEEAGYITIEKSFLDNKPRTNVSITAEGKQALVEYLSNLEQMLSSLSGMK